MPVITLISDWNTDDFYRGAVKGLILKECPDANIIDISHNIKPFNISQAAFVSKNSYHNFPDGTVHLLCVSAQNKDANYLIIEANDQFFIGADNGIFGLIFKDSPNKIVKINAFEKQSTFPELEIFAQAACQIIKGVDIENLGEHLDSYNERIPFRATIDDSVITGRIVHIDSYRNAITNVSLELFERIRNKRKFKIFVQSNSNVISSLNNNYDETAPGELLAIFNSLGLLEIAINGGNAAELLNLDTSSTIRIKFE